MPQSKVSMVKIERLPETEEGNYKIHCLPAGSDFRDPESYDTLTACWLKVNGVGFSCPAAEFSEHNEEIGVIQEVEGGSVELKVPA